jgi:hypothetical protein
LYRFVVALSSGRITEFSLTDDFREKPVETSENCRFNLFSVQKKLKIAEN